MNILNTFSGALMDQEEKKRDVSLTSECKTKKEIRILYLAIGTGLLFERYRQNSLLSLLETQLYNSLAAMI